MRSSNFELLRIIAMGMILAVHFDGAALGLPSLAQQWGLYEWTRTVVEALSIVGVNLFVLISGYFGIRLTPRKLANYIIMCGFYSITIYAAECICAPKVFTGKNTLNALLIFSSSDLWFVRDYLFLMFFAPLLNGGLNSLSRRGLNLTLVGLTIINCYFGWYCGGKVNPTGYTLMQMIFLYVIGHRLSLEMPGRRWSSVVYLLSTVVIIVLARFLPYQFAYAYNSPFVILAAVSLFALFSGLHFESRFINRVASSTFAVYLIHKNPYVWAHHLRPAIVAVSQHYSGIVMFGLLTLLLLAVYACCILIDRLRVLMHVRV